MCQRGGPEAELKECCSNFRLCFAKGTSSNHEFLKEDECCAASDVEVTVRSFSIGGGFVCQEGEELPAVVPVSKSGYLASNVESGVSKCGTRSAISDEFFLGTGTARDPFREFDGVAAQFLQNRSKSDVILPRWQS